MTLKLLRRSVTVCAGINIDTTSNCTYVDARESFGENVVEDGGETRDAEMPLQMYNCSDVLDAVDAVKRRYEAYFLSRYGENLKYEMI